jgi:hypothetical protein
VTQNSRKPHSKPRRAAIRGARAEREAVATKQLRRERVFRHDPPSMGRGASAQRPGDPRFSPENRGGTATQRSPGKNPPRDFFRSSSGTPPPGGSGALPRRPAAPPAEGSPSRADRERNHWAAWESPDGARRREFRWGGVSPQSPDCERGRELRRCALAGRFEHFRRL